MRAKSKKSDGTELPKVERVHYLVRLMSRNEYQGAATNEELAKAWGISSKTVETDAAEASRVVRMATGTSEQIREAAKEALAAIAQKGLSLGHKHPGYLRASSEAIGLLAGLGGVPPVTRTEHTGKDGAPIVPAKIGILLPEEEGEPPDGSDGA